MKKILGILAAGVACILLTGCNSKELRDLDYDLSTEMGRQLHCYAQFQKDHQAKRYGAERVNEVNNGLVAIVEGKVISDEKDYYLVCNYSDDIGDWTLNVTPISVGTAIGDPASEYCVNQGGNFEIVSNETDIYGECTLPDGTKCEEWAFYKGECQAGEGDDEPEIGYPQFDLGTEEGRIAACEERAGYYLNFNEGTFTWEDESEGGASFVRNGHVAYLKRGENAEDDVECVVDMVDDTVTVGFTNHNYLGPIEE